MPQLERALPPASNTSLAVPIFTYVLGSQSPAPAPGPSIIAQLDALAPVPVASAIDQVNPSVPSPLFSSSLFFSFSSQSLSVQVDASNLHCSSGPFARRTPVARPSVCLMNKHLSAPTISPAKMFLLGE